MLLSAVPVVGLYGNVGRSARAHCMVTITLGIFIMLLSAEEKAVRRYLLTAVKGLLTVDHQ